MKNYLTFLLLFFPLIGFSQQINENTAKTVAKNFLIEKERKFLKNTAPEIIFEDEPAKIQGKNYFIFNRKGSKGFVIISASKKTYPVLAYSLENNFPINDLPPEVEEWLNRYDAQIKQADLLKTLSSGKITKA